MISEPTSLTTLLNLLITFWLALPNHVVKDAVRTLSITAL